ncbi:hypothetical protein KY319_02550 [Candidatus Woesearchaeota archaeon]|nr:hypothetical protein [Candidatus Woesearchaeota archaeon]
MQNFSLDDLQEIRKHAHNLINRGYFTGFNIVHSNSQLPSAAIVLHFLHDNQAQIEYVTKNTKLTGFQILPRETAYMFDLIYTKKKGFEKEYANAKFIGPDGKFIPLSEVKNQKIAPLVVADELDLISPLNAQNLESTIEDLEEIKKQGPDPWIHPVIIIKSVAPCKKIPGFIEQVKYVCVSKHQDEAYALVENDKCSHLQKYVDRFVCINELGKSRPNIVVFHPSQINKEFFEYMLANAREFLPEP